MIGGPPKTAVAGARVAWGPSVCGALAGVLWLVVSPVSAQTSGTVVMTSDRTSVAVGDTFRLQVRANVTGAEVTRFDPPSLDGFAVRSRQVSRPLQFRFGFGQQQQVIQSTTVHTYVLEALTPGRHTFEPAEAEAGGHTFRSDPLTVVVGGSGATPPDPQNPQNPQNPTQIQPQQNPNAPAVAVDGAQVDPIAFIRTVADVADPYIGQQTTVSVYLYTRSPIRAAPHVDQEPTADGFWIHDLLPPQRSLDPEIQNIQGQTYRVYLIRRFAAFPLREGALTIGAPQMTLQSGSLFDLFAQPQQMERTGVAIQINARPIPNAPSGNVVVGNYSVEARIDRTQARTGDAVTLLATVRGTGNLRDVRFELPSTSALEFLQPQIQDRVEQPGDRVGGVRTFEWLVIPREPGTHVIDGLSLRVFDPETERLSTVAAPPLTLVAAGNAVPGIADPDATDPDPADVDTPVPPPTSSFAFGPIRQASALDVGRPPVSSQPWYWALLFGFPILGLTALLVGRVRRRPVDETKVAKRTARKQLADAEKHADASEPREFYAAITATLERSIEGRTKTTPRGLTHEELRALLRDRGCGHDLIRRLVEELESCDFARFSSAGGSREEMLACLKRARGLLAELERVPVAAEEAAA